MQLVSALINLFRAKGWLKPSLNGIFDVLHEHISCNGASSVNISESRPGVFRSMLLENPHLNEQWICGNVNRPSKKGPLIGWASDGIFYGRLGADKLIIGNASIGVFPMGQRIIISDMHEASENQIIYGMLTFNTELWAKIIRAVIPRYWSETCGEIRQIEFTERSSDCYFEVPRHVSPHFIWPMCDEAWERSSIWLWIELDHLFRQSSIFDGYYGTTDEIKEFVEMLLLIIKK